MTVLALASTQNALWALSLAIGAGCLLTALSRRLHLPTIVLLLAGGFLLGPEGLDILHSDDLGYFLPMVVSLAVGLILFEGGLTLNIKDFSRASTAIKRLLTTGVVITWLGSALTVYLVFNIQPAPALLMGSLIIVTGPTVIVPLLRRIRVKQKVGSILHWEAVLIDSIGVFIAILCFEWVVEGGGTVAIPNFLLRIASGISIGVSGGYIVYWTMKRNWIPGDILNAFVLASAVLIFGVTELIIPEAGLLSVTVSGLIIGIKKPRQIKEIKAFKAQIVDLLIGLLFLLLVSRLEIRQFVEFFRAGGGWVLASTILLIRPLSVMICAWGTSLRLGERILLGWIAPRGVVAASMASLFALSLQAKGNLESAALMESFVYSIICATVLIQGLSAGFVAKKLGLQRPAPNDLIIIGAHYFARELARLLGRENRQKVILLDANTDNVESAKEEGLIALHCDAMKAEQLYEEQQMLFGTGHMLALTDNVELNQILMQRWADILGEDRVSGWIPSGYLAANARLTGQAAFGSLVRPTEICAEMLQEESSLESVIWEEDKSLPSGDWHPLYILRGKSLKILPNDTPLREIVKNNDEIICLRSSEGFLFRALHNGGFRKIHSTDIDDLYRQLAKIISPVVGGMSEDKILESLEEQKSIFPAYLGNGIAIPHIYSTHLEQRVCFLVSLEKGLSIPEEGTRIDCIFMLISPSGDSEGHLATLADISKTCRSTRRRKQLREAGDIEDVLTAITVDPAPVNTSAAIL